VTVVVGVRGRNGVLLAADSAATVVGYGKQRERRNGKVHLLNDTVAIGICGSPRISQLLRFMAASKPPLERDPYEWAVESFIPDVRKRLRDGGTLEVSNCVESFYGGFLLGVRDHLFEVGGDLQVGECEFPWTTDGSGEDAAAGYFHAQLGDGLDPISDEKLLGLARGACQSAVELNAYCGGKITHVRTKRYTEAEKKLARVVLGRAA
jgi:20S proteasome alpha/beta subunit